MKLRFLFLQLFVFLSLYVFSQNNLFTTNPYFISGVSGWNTSNGVTLTHETAGAETTGSAKATAATVDGNIRKRYINSSQILIPDSVKGNLLFVSFYVKAFAGSEVQVRVMVVDDNNNWSVVKSPTYKPDTVFKKFSFPVHTFSNTVKIYIRPSFGSVAGTYYFDDFWVVSSATDLDSINRFEEDWTPRFFAKPDSLVSIVLPQNTPDVIVTLNPDSVITEVSFTQFGVNSNFRSGDGIVNRSHLYDEFGAFRYPAGSGSNTYFWDCNIPDSFAIDVNAYCGTYWKFTDPDHFLTFRENAKGEPTIVVNYFYARYGVTPEGTREARVRQAAEYAASWVHYYNVEKQANIKYWEIGNECYGSWETGYDVNGSIVTGKEYGEDLRVFSEKMKAVDSTIKIGAVLSHNDFEWNNQVMGEVGNYADFLIVHHYFNVNDLSSTVTALDEIHWDMQELQASAYHYSGMPEGHYPVAFTEYNLQGKPTTSMVNGLFVADALGTMVKNRFFLSTIWVNEWGVNDYTTHGILSKGDPYQADYTARPSYTPYYYYGKCFGDLMIDVSVANNDSVHAFGSSFSDGNFLGLVILNYSGTGKNVKINFTGNTDIDSAFWYSVYSDNLNDGNTKFYVNGLTSSTTGGGPADLDSVFSYNAAVNQNSVIAVPKYSVTYLVLHKTFNSSPTGIWTGAFSDDWSVAYNWQDKRVPDSTTNVTVSSQKLSGRGFYPTKISKSPAVCNDLIIENGALLKIPTGKNFIVKGNLTIR